MNRLFRLLRILVRALWAPRCEPLGPSRTPLRVWPTDLDVFFHVNNGVYLTLCDLGRVDLALRSGTLRAVAGRRRVFMVAAETIQLRQPLRLFQRFEIETRVIGWDDKAFFVEHRFVVRPRGAEPRAGGGGERVVALAVVEGRVSEAGRGRVAPGDLLARVGISDPSPPLPDWVRRWKDDQRQLRESARAEAVGA